MSNAHTRRFSGDYEAKLFQWSIFGFPPLVYGEGKGFLYVIYVLVFLMVLKIILEWCYVSNQSFYLEYTLYASIL